MAGSMVGRLGSITRGKLMGMKTIGGCYACCCSCVDDRGMHTHSFSLLHCRALFLLHPRTRQPSQARRDRAGIDSHLSMHSSLAHLSPGLSVCLPASQSVSLPACLPAGLPACLPLEQQQQQQHSPTPKRRGSFLHCHSRCGCYRRLGSLRLRGQRAGTPNAPRHAYDGFVLGHSRSAEGLERCALFVGQSGEGNGLDGWMDWIGWMNGAASASLRCWCCAKTMLKTSDKRAGGRAIGRDAMQCNAVQ